MLTGDRCDKKRLFAINVVDVDFWLAEGGRFFTRKQSINVHSKCVRTSTWIELFWLQGRELPGFHHCNLRRQVRDGFSARCIYLRDLRVLTLFSAYRFANDLVWAGVYTSQVGCCFSGRQIQVDATATPVKLLELLPTLPTIVAFNTNFSIRCPHPNISPLDARGRRYFYMLQVRDWLVGWKNPWRLFQVQ